MEPQKTTQSNLQVSPLGKSLLTRVLTTFDMYEIQMGFSHENRLVYKSNIGGILSLVTFSIIFAYLVYLLSDVWNFKVSIKNSTKKRDLAFDGTTVSLDGANFDFAIYWDYIQENETIKEHMFKYASISIEQTTGFRVNTSYGLNYTWRTDTYLPIEKCQNNSYNGDVKYLEALDLIDNAFCTVNKSFTIKGSGESEEFSFFVINIRECKQEQLDQFDPGETCAPLEEQQAVVSQISVYVNFMTSYFQGENKDSPILPTYEEFPFAVPKGLSTLTQVKLALNQAILEDSWFSSSFGVRNVSYISSRVLQTFNRDQIPYHPETPFISVILSLDNNIYISQRTAFNLIDAFGKLGGFASLVMTFTTSSFYMIQKLNYLFMMLNEFFVFEGSYEETIEQTNKSSLVSSKFMKNIAAKAQMESKDQIQTIVEKFTNQGKYFNKWIYMMTICQRKNHRRNFTSSLLQNLQKEFSIEHFIQKIRTFDLFMDLKLLPYQKKVLQTLSRKRDPHMKNLLPAEIERDDLIMAFKMLQEDAGSPNKQSRKLNQDIRQMIGVESQKEIKHQSTRQRNRHNGSSRSSINQHPLEQNAMGFMFEQDSSSRVLIDQPSFAKQKSGKKKTKKDVLKQ